jgi:hypothetical protein
MPGEGYKTTSAEAVILASRVIIVRAKCATNFSIYN